MSRPFRRLALITLLCLTPLLAQTAPPSAAQVEARVDGLLKQLSLDEKIDLLGGVDDFYIRNIDHIGLPRLKMADGPLGVRNYGPSTAFGGVALAATWDPGLARKLGQVLGQDARARGVHFLLGPGVNIYRAPLCGRDFEYFGEDPFLDARIDVAYIEGLQSQGVSATVKHFMGNNQEYDRHNMNSVIDERTMREIYLPAFEAAVREAHVGAIMDSYNLTNGVHMTQNGYLNTDVAKKDWGFDGIMMSDWTSTYDGIAAANGGLDLEMPAGDHMNRATLLPAIGSGKVTEATIDDKVRRILRVAVRFGWLDHDQADLSVPRWNPEGNEVSLEAARSSMVLLKNEGNLLPLNRDRVKSITIVGPAAYPADPVGGGSAEVKPFTPVSYFEGVARYLGSSAKVYYARGLPTFEEMAKATKFTTEAQGSQPGLKAEFFRNQGLSGAPSVTRVDKFVDYDTSLNGDEPTSDVSARWTGYYTPATPGNYVLFVQGPGENGGYRLLVDRKIILDDWKDAYAFLGQATLNLTAGAHQVELDWFLHGKWGRRRLRLGIVRPETLVSADAKSLASHSDAVIVAAGFDSAIEGESADRTFELPPGQDELIRQIAAANQKTIVVMTAGGGVDMSAWVDQVPALFQSWYSGQQGGAALAQLLFGDYNPSGRLPISMERRWEDNAVHDSYYPHPGEDKVAYSEGIFVGYRHFDKSGIKPLFPFGYGLSYSTFAYKNLNVSPDNSGENLATVSFEVTNTGSRSGAEVAQVYVGDRHASVPRPVKELKGFAKMQLSPGETKHVLVQLDRRAFSYYDVKRHQWNADPGEFDILVGRSAAQIELTGKFVLR
ncbi:MAG TPA: glycoside hydrolase family 3 C-terminal domain-containing protein [Terriglobales bacterium]|nr:glycoside hydrolase family 3 C-terminal domain-containing protein [Terriglobales bacterium]